MLPRATSYETLVAEFAWEIPERYNMAWDACDRWAGAEPNRLAIIDRADAQAEFTYGELASFSNRLATALHRTGIRAGDRVAVFRPQSIWTAIAHLAIWKLGAISVPLFPLFGDQALRTRLDDAGVVLVISDAEGARRLGTRLPVLVPETADLPDGAGFVPAMTAAEDPALLIYTSGTTGAPKGAVLPHRALLGHLPGVELSHDGGFHTGDVLWTPADWAWIGGLLDVLMPGLREGIPVVASRMPKFAPRAAAALIGETGVRSVFFPPTALRMLRSEGVTIDGLRTVASGGEPLGAEMLDWGQRALGLTINEFYGQTECNMIVSCCGALFPSRPGSTGRPVPGHTVAVIGPDGAPVEGEGDIAVRRGSASMMLGYWKNLKATAAKFRGDWLITGDRGTMEDGYIRFIGRDDDVITSAGYRIGPAEIEDCLLSHPAVATVGVVGRPDPERTEIVQAHIVLADGIRPSEALTEELKSHVRAHLSAHLYPREIIFAESLPMTVTGKIIRRALRDRAAEPAT